MHQCNYCSESFFSGYSLMSHMKVHKDVIKNNNNNANGNYAMDYSWQHHSWQWTPSSSSTTATTTGSSSNNNSLAETSSTISTSSSSGSSEEGGPLVGNKGSSSKSGSYKSIGEKIRKEYECENCNKIFRSYPGLRYHRNSKHTQDGPYKCNYCEKRFCQKSHLARHETLHTGEKNYSCTYCEKTFRIKGNLQIHLRIHTGEKPYECKTCGKKFTQQQSAKSHEKLHNKYK